MNTNNLITCARSALAAIAIAAIMPLSGCNEAPARVEPPPPKVSVQHPEMRKVTDYDPYNGWLKATDTVDIRARVRGHLQKIDFTDGDMVKKDQLLFELDPRPFETEIGRASDQVKIYDAQLVAAAKEETRLKDLLAKGGASQSQVDSTEAQRKALEAQIEASKQEVKRRELDLEYARVTSPLAGKIGLSIFSVGALINAGPGEDQLATVVSVDPIDVYFDIDERSLQRYAEMRGATTRAVSVREMKLPFDFALETEQGFPHSGVIDFANNQVDSQTGTIQIRGVVANPAGRFIPGSRVRIRVSVGDSRPEMLIPDTAILSDQDKRYVLAIDEKNVVQRRDVNPGKLLDDGSRVIVGSADAKAALSDNDWIIVQGLQMARINYAVDPIRPTTQATTAPTAAGAAAAQ